MKKIPLALALVAAALMTASTNADTVTFDYNIDSIDSGIVVDDTFDLGDVSSIKSISIDMAHTWGGDLEITLTNLGNGTSYELMFDDVDETGSGNFDLGAAAGDGSLGNVGKYLFVESGGAADFTDDYSAPGTYNANSWGGGGSGDWQLIINDDAAGDVTSIGSVTIDFNSNVIPEPTSVAVILGMVGFVASRRRR